jgi:hypothetical protein
VVLDIGTPASRRKKRNVELADLAEKKLSFSEPGGFGVPGSASLAWSAFERDAAGK